MGLESANYMLVPKESVAAMPAVLLSLGGEKQAPTSPVDTFERWVMRGERYWLDVMLIGGSGLKSKPTISVRISLSNPVEAEDVLHRLLSELMAEVPGQLYDQQTRRSHAQMSEDVWRDIVAGYKEKQARFQQHFGPFEAPISGEDVFPRLQASKGANDRTLSTRHSCRTGCRRARLRRGSAPPWPVHRRAEARHRAGRSFTRGLRSLNTN